MKKVAIGLLGPTLDRGLESSRWEHWRPSVSLFQHEDLLIDRFDMIYQTKFKKLAKVVMEDIRSVSPETKVVPHIIELNDAWDFEEVYGKYHDFAKTYEFDPDSEQYLVHITTGTHVAQICLFLLAESRYLPGKLIQTRPNARAHEGTEGAYTIIDLDLSKYDQLAMRFQQEFQEGISFLKSGIETKNQAFNLLIEKIERVAIRSDDPILLMGPTGAGKSRLARRIYDLKLKQRQFTGRFVEINCATIRGDSAMSALFGHRKGSFTTAVSDREGLLCSADQGMLFLDEVGELGQDEQAMLLRAIEEKRFLPFGADSEQQSDFQLICGTNRDLQKEVRKGAFREDLLSRINLWTFHMPGLSHRPEDIEPNLKYELDRFAERKGTRVTFNKEALNRFLSFATSTEAIWSANFRDLNGAVTRMATLAPGGRITPDVVSDEIDCLCASWQPMEKNADADLLSSILGTAQVKQLDRFDSVQLAEVLRTCRASKTLSEAGRKLFAKTRQKKARPNDADRLRKYLAKFGLSWGDISE